MNAGNGAVKEWLERSKDEYLDQVNLGASSAAHEWRGNEPSREEAAVCVDAVLAVFECAGTRVADVVDALVEAAKKAARYNPTTGVRAVIVDYANWAARRHCDVDLELRASDLPGAAIDYAAPVLVSEQMKSSPAELDQWARDAWERLRADGVEGRKVALIPPCGADESGVFATFVAEAEMEDTRIRMPSLLIAATGLFFRLHGYGMLLLIFENSETGERQAVGFRPGNAPESGTDLCFLVYTDPGSPSVVLQLHSREDE